MSATIEDLNLAFTGSATGRGDQVKVHGKYLKECIRKMIDDVDAAVPQAPAFPPEPEPWVRPADWLALPTISPGDQIFAGLFAIFDGNPNYVALVAEGDYTVDWGDGVVEDFASGVTAEHDYDYAAYDVPAATRSTRGYKQAVIVVTPQEGSDLTFVIPMVHVEAPASYAWLEFAVNGPLLTSFYWGIPIPHLERVFVGQNAIADFNSALSFAPGLQSVEITELNSATDLGTLFQDDTSLRSIILPDLPLCTTLYEAFYNCTALEKIVIGNCPLLEDGTYMAEGCSALRVFQIGQMGSLASESVIPSSMFDGCYALTHATFGDCNLATFMNYSDMFANAGSPLYLSIGDLHGNYAALDFNALGIDNPYLIQYIKIGNLPDVTSLANMCDDLEGLRIFEMGDAPLCADFSGAWQTTALESFIAGDMSAAITMANAFDDGALRCNCTLGNFPVCVSFASAFHGASGFGNNGPQEITLGNIDGSADFTDVLTYSFNLRKLTVGNIIGTTFPTALFASAPAAQEIVVGDMPDMESLGDTCFSNLPQLRSLTIGDLPACTDFNSLTEGSTNLETFSCGNTPALLGGANILGSSDPGSLKDIAVFDTSKATGLNGFFDNQPCLRDIPAFDLSAATSLNNFVEGCTALSRSQVFGARVSHSYANCNLQVPALVEIFENLGNSAGIVLTFAVGAGGSGHAPLDVVSFGDTTVTVDTVDGGGAILTATLADGGTAKLIGATLAQTASTGVGIDAEIEVLTVTGDQEITVTGNPGTPYLTVAQIAIAEAKGWTVVTA